MNEDIIADFKQFIAATIRQEISGVSKDISGIKSDISGIRADIARLDKKVDILDKKIDDKIDEVLAAVGDATDSRFEVVEQDVSNLQTRVNRLETAK